MASTLAAAQADAPTVRLWTRTDYHRLAEALGEEPRMELIEGRIFRKHTGEPRLWTVEEYRRIPEDLLSEGERTELIEGQIYTRMGQNDPHIFALNFAARALRTAFGPDFDLLTQTPLRLGDHSNPEPDVFVFRGTLPSYEGRSDELAPNVVLVVEVSDTTLAFDRKAKASLYASSGIPEYWIVNLRERTLEVRRDPQGQGYGETLVLGEGQSISIGEGTISVSEILPKP